MLHLGQKRGATGQPIAMASGICQMARISFFLADTLFSCTQKGQLGHGDLVQRNIPAIVEALAGKKIIAGKAMPKLL